jgi:hypothetical protein
MAKNTRRECHATDLTQGREIWKTLIDLASRERYSSHVIGHDSDSRKLYEVYIVKLAGRLALEARRKTSARTYGAAKEEMPQK